MVLHKIHQSIDSLYQDTVQVRRYLHQHPELSFHETKTAAYIASQYESLGIPVRKQVGGNGVVATLKGGKPGRTIALRADFDALPIQDEKDVPYKSTVDGVMHACGHDGHTASLLSIAKAALPFQDELPGTLIFLHQHAEELTPGGAKTMIQDGALDGVDAVFGTHLWSTSPLGTVETNRHAFMAGADRFSILIKGQGGHGGYPHETKDALVIGAQLVTELQQIVSRKINPLETAIITIGAFHSGNAFNVVADQSEVIGTVRYLNTEVQDKIILEMENFIKGASLAHGVSYEFEYIKGYPPLVNHPEEASLLLEAAGKVDGITQVREVAPSMAGEDFAYYMLERPGAYFFTGARPDGDVYPHHHPKFDINEKALPLAAKSLISAYFAYQEAHPLS